MTKRIIAATFVLCVAVGLTAWGWEYARSAFVENAEFGDNESAAVDDADEPIEKQSTEKRTRAQMAEPRHTVKELPAQHATEAEDLASLRAIRTQSAAMFAEYNARQASAYAERFLPNAEYEMDTGEVIIGRSAIQEHFEKLFAEYPQGDAHSHESNIRTVSLNMAIEDGIVAINHSADDEEVVSPYLAIWMLVDGRWFLASMRELTRQEGLHNAHDHLQELAWLVGDWLDETDDSVVNSSCRWGDDGNFLIQDFTVHIQGSFVASGTQRIGYDPLTHKFRSWVFDSHGGFGESFWNWDGEKWVIRSSAVRHDGYLAASLNFIIPHTQDSYFWESSHRMSNGDILPDLRIKIVRQAPPPPESDTPNE